MWGDRGWFPRSPHDRLTRKAPSSTPAASPTPTPQTFSVASPPVKESGFGVDLPTLGRTCAAPRPKSARFRAGTTITELQPLVHSRYTVWSRLPDPARLAVPCRPNVVGAACRPHRRSPAQAAPSFTRTAATARRRRIHTSIRSCALRGAREVGPGRPASVATGGSPRTASRTRRACCQAPGSPQAPSEARGRPHPVMGQGVGITAPRYR